MEEKWSALMVITMIVAVAVFSVIAMAINGSHQDTCISAGKTWKPSEDWALFSGECK